MGYCGRYTENGYRYGCKYLIKKKKKKIIENFSRSIRNEGRGVITQDYIHYLLIFHLKYVLYNIVIVWWMDDHMQKKKNTLGKEIWKKIFGIVYGKSWHARLVKRVQNKYSRSFSQCGRSVGSEKSFLSSAVDKNK